MPTALIKYSQGGVDFPAGKAGFGSIGVPVDISNDSAVDVASWKIELVYVPPGSAVATGLLANANDANPAASFTPDKVGSYRVVLTVYTSVGLVGVKDVDIRVFVIEEPRYGFVFPPYQQLPDRRPLLGTGSVGEKPDEMNHRDNPYGWDGDGNDGLMLDVLRQLGNSTLDRIPDPETGLIGDTLEIAQHAWTSLQSIFTDTLRIFALEGQHLSKGNQSGFRETLTFDPSIDFLNGVFANDSIWLVGGLNNNDGILTQVIGVKTTMEVGPGGYTEPGCDGFRDIAFDGTDLWVVGNQDWLQRVSSVTGAAIGGPTPVSGSALEDNWRIVYDPVDEMLWTIGGPGGVPATLYRVNPVGPAVNGMLAVGPMHTALAVGLGYVWVAENTVPATLHRIDRSTVLVDDSLVFLAAEMNEVAGIEIDYIRNRVLVYGLDDNNDAWYVEVDPTTMLVVGIPIQLTNTTTASISNISHFVGASYTTPIGPSLGTHTGVGGAWLPVNDGTPGGMFIVHAQGGQASAVVVPSQKRYVVIPPVTADATQVRSEAGAYTVPGGVLVGDVVYSTGNFTADKANNGSDATAPAIGIVVAKPTGVTATVAYSGEVSWAGPALTPGVEYYLGATGDLILGGAVPVAVGSVSQELGTAVAPDKFLLAIKQHIIL